MVQREKVSLVAGAAITTPTLGLQTTELFRDIGNIVFL